MQHVKANHKGRVQPKICGGRVKGTSFLPSHLFLHLTHAKKNFKRDFFPALYSTAASAASQIALSENAGIEPRTVATSSLTVRRSNHSRIDLIHQIIKMTTCSFFSFLYFLHVSRSESERGGDTGHGQHSRQGLSLNQLSLSQTEVSL